MSAYEEVVHWRPNVFMIPFGKAFVRELAKLYQAFADQSALHSIALMACSVMQPLLLQKPYKQSKAKDHSICLSRLDLWRKGCFTDLLNECRCIQQHLRNPQSHKSGSHSISRLFDHLMSEGKINMALRLLAEDSKGGVLSLDSSIPCGTDSSGKPAFRPVRDILFEKHPCGRDPPHHVLLDCTTEKPCYDPVIFQCLTGNVIRRAAIQTHGAAGSSGVDAYA